MSKVSVYRRFFRIESPELIKKILENADFRNKYFEKARELGKKLGADQLYTDGNEIAGFSFKKNQLPKGQENDWKRVENCDGIAFFPKKNTLRGREINKMLDHLGEPPQQGEMLLNDILPTWRASLTIIPRMYWCSLYGREDRGWFVSVPWQDRDPAELEEYRKERDKGKQGDSNLDHLLWVPPADWVEVKEWEVLKALDDTSKEEQTA